MENSIFYGNRMRVKADSHGFWPRSLKAAAQILIALLFLGLPLSSLEVKLQITKIQREESGFIVEGTVSATGMNPKGQIVESDDMTITAEIKDSPGALYPIPPEGYAIRTPAGVETSYYVGKRYLSKKEFYGIGIKRVDITRIAMRKPSVWRAYGGLGTWRKKAPPDVTKKFSGKIPLKYEGKRLRIRATLRHVFGGPYAAWSAYTFFHDIGHQGVLETGNIKKPLPHTLKITSGPEGSPNPAVSGGKVQCSISAEDSHKHKPVYLWSVRPAAGSFSNPGAAVTTWTAPKSTMEAVRNYTISCTVTCPQDKSLTAAGSYVQDLCPALKPVTVILRLSAPGFKSIEKRSLISRPDIHRLTFYGPVLPLARNSKEAGRLGAGVRVTADLSVEQEGEILRIGRDQVKMYGTYWVTVQLNPHARCAKKESLIRRRPFRMVVDGGEAVEVSKKKKMKDLYQQIADKYKGNSRMEKIFNLLGMYKAYQNDKQHLLAGGRDTPAMNLFLKNLRQGRIGRMKNALNTIWEFAKDPMTAGGSKVEDIIQNSNKAWKRLTGKGFLKKKSKGWNAIKAAGEAMKQKLKDFKNVGRFPSP